MSNMKTVCGRVKSNVKCCLSIVYQFSDFFFICYLIVFSPFFDIKKLSSFLKRTRVYHFRVTTFICRKLTFPASISTAFLRYLSTITSATPSQPTKQLCHSVQSLRMYSSSNVFLRLSSSGCFL